MEYRGETGRGCRRWNTPRPNSDAKLNEQFMLLVWRSHLRHLHYNHFILIIVIYFSGYVYWRLLCGHWSPFDIYRSTCKLDEASVAILLKHRNTLVLSGGYWCRHNSALFLSAIDETVCTEAWTQLVKQKSKRQGDKDTLKGRKTEHFKRDVVKSEKVGC